jgi:tripartite-type tricarboxylate transporter receptor subunit TctC
MQPSVMLSRRQLLLGSAAVAATAGFGLPASALVIEGNSSILIGYPPGGATDTVARFLADKLRESYASTIIVDNKPGANGQIAAARLKDAPADGTLMLLSPSPAIVISPHLYPTLSYAPLRDFKPVTLVSTFPHLLAVGPGVPAEVKTIGDLLQWFKANPQKASYGTPGNGSAPHFLGVEFGRAAGIALTHVPYKGDAPALQDLLGGQIPLVIAPLGAVLPHVQAGKLRGLATTGAARAAVLPDVPTIREAGFASVELTDWFGLFVPVATPAALIDKLHACVRDALQTAHVREGLAKLAYEPGGELPTAYADRVRAEYERWGPVVKLSGFKPEQ